MRTAIATIVLALGLMACQTTNVVAPHLSDPDPIQALLETKVLGDTAAGIVETWYKANTFTAIQDNDFPQRDDHMFVVIFDKDDIVYIGTKLDDLQTRLRVVYPACIVLTGGITAKRYVAIYLDGHQ